MNNRSLISRKKSHWIHNEEYLPPANGVPLQDEILQTNLVEETPADPNGGVSDERKQRGVTPRVVGIALILAALLGYIIPIVDFKLRNTYLGATHLPPGAIGVLLVLVWL